MQEGGLPCLHPLPCTHTLAQAALPTPQTPSEPSPAGHPHQGPRRGPMGTPGDATALPSATSAASPDRCCLPQVSFPAQRRLSRTTGKRTCSPWPKPALPVGDGASTHAYKYIYICIFAYICGDGTFFFFKQSVHKCQRKSRSPFIKPEKCI